MPNANRPAKPAATAHRLAHAAKALTPESGLQAAAILQGLSGAEARIAIELAIARLREAGAQYAASLTE